MLILEFHENKSFIPNFSGDRIPQDLADEIVRVTPPKLQPGIKTKVNNLMREPGNKDLANSVLVDRVLAGSQGDIINAIKAVDRYKVFQDVITSFYRRFANGVLFRRSLTLGTKSLFANFYF